MRLFLITLVSLFAGIGLFQTVAFVAEGVWSIWASDRYDLVAVRPASVSAKVRIDKQTAPASTFLDALPLLQASNAAATAEEANRLIMSLGDGIALGKSPAYVALRQSAIDASSAIEAASKSATNVTLHSIAALSTAVDSISKLEDEHRGRYLSELFGNSLLDDLQVVARQLRKSVVDVLSLVDVATAQYEAAIVHVDNLYIAMVKEEPSALDSWIQHNSPMRILGCGDMAIESAKVLKQSLPLIPPIQFHIQNEHHSFTVMRELVKAFVKELDERGAVFTRGDDLMIGLSILADRMARALEAAGASHGRH